MERTLRATISLAFLAWLVAGCSQPPPNVSIDIRTPVEVETIELGTVESVIVATGNLQTRDSARVNAQVPGRIYLSRDEKGKRFTEGRQVNAGDVLGQITGEETRLQANLETAILSLQSATDEHNRRTKLFEQGHIPETDLTQSELSLQQAQDAYDRAKLSDENTQITSPIDGVILTLARDENNVPIADGQLIGSGLLVAQIASLDVLEAYVDLIGPELSRVREGLQVRVSHYAFEDVDILGQVVRLSPTVDPQTHTFQAVIEVENQERVLRPGMFIQVEIITEQRLDVPVVSYEAISRRGRDSVVFVLDGQRVKRTTVQLGLADDDHQEVIEGVKPGDKVVVRGLETLQDNALVRVLGG
ncbi:MAG: efflux RND transporter periplasmic adaptor subunit [Gammaproteobacteria bacterium]|nr:efflux RND transporter periplasmic adaptor subunit [Gammaproteobacteria bacterium]